MIQTRRDAELQQVQVQVRQLGSLVDEALDRALDALHTQDEAKAETAIMADESIDELNTSIERETFDLLSAQQPVGASDLRILTSLPPIAVDLERIGDEAVDIAQMVLRMLPLLPVQSSQSKEDEKLRTLFDLGQQARAMLRRTMQALANHNADAARAIWLENAAMHTRCYKARSEISAALEFSNAIPALLRDPFVLRRIMCLLAIVHCVERVADHCSNVCERVLYMVFNETEVLPVLEEV